MPATPLKPKDFQRPTGGYFDLVPTPDPAQLSFRVKDHAADFQATQMPAVGTRYAACNMLKTRPKIQLEGYQDYVYLMCQREGDWLWFYFGKNKTVAQRNTPFRSFYDNRNYPWPSVLESIYFVSSSSFVQSVYNGTTTATAPSYFARYRYRPQVPYNSSVLVEQFLAEAPWEREELMHQQPVPTDINASYVGINIDFPRCLHGKATFPELVPGAQIVQGVGTENPRGDQNTTEMIFPATNFEDWAPFVIEDSQQPTNGLWLRERVTIYPPPLPDTIER